jgi:hypothetical protein
MTEVTTAAVVEPKVSGLASRLVGVVFSPRATYQEIAARPRSIGALVVTVGVGAVLLFAFLSTEVGQNAMLDQQIVGMERFGIEVTPQAVQRMEEGVPRMRYFAVLPQVIFGPVVAAIVAGLLLVVFNAFLDGEAKFRQMYAIVAHAGIIITLQQLFAMPLNYARGEMGSPASLGAFAAALDPDGFIAGFLGALDVFFIWWFFSLAVGLAVLYKRRTGPIATSLFCVYGVIAFVIALF